MPYAQVLYFQAQYLNNLGPSASGDRFRHFRGIYYAILNHWFTLSRGYFLTQFMGGRKNYIVRRGGEESHLLIVEINGPSKWMAVANGQDKVDSLQTDMKESIELTRYNTIYGIRAVGLQWMVYKMEKLGGPEPALVTVLDWQDDITSDNSYTQFQTIADRVYRITQPDHNS